MMLKMKPTMMPNATLGTSSGVNNQHRFEMTGDIRTIVARLGLKCLSKSRRPFLMPILAY